MDAVSSGTVHFMHPHVAGQDCFAFQWWEVLGTIQFFNNIQPKKDASTMAIHIFIMLNVFRCPFQLQLAQLLDVSAPPKVA